MKWFVSISFLLLFHLSYCQTEETKGKLGIKTSIIGSLLTGNELQNARPKFGYTAGAFYQYPLTSNFGVYTELSGSFKGSKFNNATNEYSKIAIFYLDMPLLLSYQTASDAKNQFALGPYLSYQALSSLFVGEKKKAEINDLALKDIDLGLALFYHKKGKFSTFQVGAKVGLRNINDGINFVNIKPETGKNESIFNLGFEIGYLF